MAGELIRYDAMCQAIATAYQVDEVKDIRDRAITLEHYSRLAHNVEAERQCCEIRLRAERKAGQLLAKREKAKGAREPGTNRGTTPSDGTRASKTMADLGISYDQASQWQKLADVPEAQFEAALAAPEKPTTNGIINSAAPATINPVSAEALWLWGRLRDFERMGLLATTPTEVMVTMTPTMTDDVRAGTPRVIAWLSRIGEEQ
jgi:hypothetical protein